MVAISNPPAKTRESVCADTPSAYGNARHYRMAGTAEEAMMTASGNSGRGLRAGRLSMTDNVVGYAGYIFNAELVSAGSTGLYTVRHRHYAPDLGRWLSRDPLGYVDGMSLYEYVAAAGEAAELDSAGGFETRGRLHKMACSQATKD